MSITGGKFVLVMSTVKLSFPPVEVFSDSTSASIIPG